MMNAMKEIEKALAVISENEDLVGKVEWRNTNSTFASVSIESKYGLLEAILVVEVLESYDNKKAKYTVAKLNKRNREEGYYGEAESFTRWSAIRSLKRALELGSRTGKLMAERGLERK